MRRKSPEASYPDCYLMIVRDVEVDCFLGVYPEEQKYKRPVVIHVTLHVLDTLCRQTLPAIEKGEHFLDEWMSCTVNYERVLEIIEQLTAERRFGLIETLCSALLDCLGKLSGLRAIQVCVEKPRALLRIGSVVIEMNREF